MHYDFSLSKTLEFNVYIEKSLAFVETRMYTKGLIDQTVFQITTNIAFIESFV